jgi:hypothetical protein
VGATPAALRPGISGEFDFGHGRVRTVPDFAKFYGDDANEPSADKAAWVLEQTRAIAPNGIEAASFNAELSRRVFRSDLYAEAMRVRGLSVAATA